MTKNDETIRFIDDWKNVQNNKSELLCLSLPVDLTDDQIKECVQGMMPVCFKRRQGFCLTIFGFDSDPRELWEIPEAITFMQKLLNFGVISGLEVTTSIPELMDKKWKGQKLPGLGAIEVWMCANGMLSAGKNEINHQMFRQFEKVLTKSNQVADAICKEKPYEAGFNMLKNSNVSSYIPDAPIKHSGYRKL